MKRQLTAVVLFSLAFAALQLPARADFNVNFGRHDRNHDGRWDYREFNDANTCYYQSHPEVQVISRRDMRRDFSRMDINHDGYLEPTEVQTYHTW